MDRMAETRNYINVLGIIIHAFPARRVFVDSEVIAARDYIIVDQQKKPMIITLLGEFEDIEGAIISQTIVTAPIILGIRLKVTTKNYLSLSTQPTSIILVHPSVKEAIELDEWYHQNISELGLLIYEETCNNPQMLLPPPHPIQIKKIITLQTTRNKRAIWIKGEIESILNEGSLWHSACSNCYMPYDSTVRVPDYCGSCQKQIILIARASITIRIRDDTEAINTIISGQEAERLMNITVSQIQQAEEQNANLATAVTAALKGKGMLCFIRQCFDQFNLSKTAKHLIVTFYLSDAMPDAASSSTN